MYVTYIDSFKTITRYLNVTKLFYDIKKEPFTQHLLILLSSTNTRLSSGIRILLTVSSVIIVNISVFNALSIGSGLVAAALLCIKRGRN